MCNEYIGVPGDVRMTMLILDIDFEESLCYLSEGAFLHAIFFFLISFIPPSSGDRDSDFTPIDPIFQFKVLIASKEFVKTWLHW